MDNKITDPVIIKRRIIIANVIFTVLLIPLPVLIVGTVYMMSITAGAENSIVTLLFSLAFFSYIPIYLTSIIGGWSAYFFNHYKAAQIFCLLPVIDIALSLIGALLLIFFCDGDFVCKGYSYN